MKFIIGKMNTGLICLALLLPCFAIAEPYAALMPLSSQGKTMVQAAGKTDAQRAKEAPAKKEIDIPAYPGAYQSMTSKSDGVWNSVQLISNDSPGKIIAWYKKMTGKKWQYVPDLAIKQMGEVGVFLETSKKNIDDFDAMKYRSIRIQKVEKKEDLGFAATMGDLPKAKAVINIQLKPMM